MASHSLQVRDYALSLAIRYIVPLLLAAAAALALSKRYTDAIAIAAICSMGPISEQVRPLSPDQNLATPVLAALPISQLIGLLQVAYYAQLFQLSEAVADKALSGSRLISIGTLAALTPCLVLSTPPTEALSRCSGLSS